MSTFGAAVVTLFAGMGAIEASGLGAVDGVRGSALATDALVGLGAFGGQAGGADLISGPLGLAAAVGFHSASDRAKGGVGPVGTEPSFADGAFFLVSVACV